MVQYYTLEEAAKILHTTPDQIKEMAKNGEIRPFQDRGNLRFRSQEVTELARAKGFGSDPELVLGEINPPAEARSKPSSSKAGSKGPKTAPPEDAGAVFDFTLSTDESGVVPLGTEPPSGSKSGPSSSSMRRKSPSPRPSGAKAPPPMVASDSDVRLVAEGSELDFKIADESSRSPQPKKASSGGKAKSTPSGPRDSEVQLTGPGEQPPDSDVQLVGEMPGSSLGGRQPGKKPSDSDIRMVHGDLPAPSSKKLRKEVITEEIDLDAEFQKAEEASRGKGAGRLPTVKAGGAPKLPTSSPFELSEEDLKRTKPPKTPSKMEAPRTPSKAEGPKTPPKSTPKSSPSARKTSKEDDSSDEFTVSQGSKDDSSGEATALDSGSDEMPVLKGDEEVSLGEISGAAGGSGINLQSPADSGISLEQGGSDEIEFELSLDSSDDSKSLIGKGDKKKTNLQDQPEGSSDFELSLKEESESSDSGSSSDSEFELTLDGEESVEAKPIKKDSESSSSSESEFELTLDESSSGSGRLAVEGAGSEEDIFETDFEVPSLEEGSGSEAVALESDTDVETSDFDLAKAGESGLGSQVVELEDESADSGAATIRRPARRGKAAIADEAEVETDAEELLDREEEETVRTVAVEAPPAEWGLWPIALIPSVLFLFLASLMGFELLQGMWAYNHGSRATGYIVDPIARMIDDSLPKGD